MNIKVGVLALCVVFIFECFANDSAAMEVNNITEQTRFLGLEKAVDFLTIISYWPSCINAHEQFIAAGIVEPEIMCSVCTTKIVKIGELSGGLIGKGLRDLVDGIDNTDASKVMLDEFLALIRSVDSDGLRSFMVRAANEIGLTCTHCGGKSYNWTSVSDMPSADSFSELIVA